MDKKLHITFAIEGEDVDKIDIYAMLMSLPESDKLKITSGHTSIYYTKKEEK